MLGSIQTYGVYICMGGIDIWGAYGLGAYRHPRYTDSQTWPPHAYQLYLKEYGRRFSFPWSWAMFIIYVQKLRAKTYKISECTPINNQNYPTKNWWMLKSWRKRKEYNQFTKISPFISSHTLPYNLSRAAPPQVYGYLYSLHVQAITLGVGKENEVWLNSKEHKRVWGICTLEHYPKSFIYYLVLISTIPKHCSRIDHAAKQITFIIYNTHGMHWSKSWLQ